MQSVKDRYGDSRRGVILKPCLKDFRKVQVTPILDSNISMTEHATVTYFYNADERQSVKNLTAATGGVAQSYECEPHGQILTAFGERLISSISLITNHSPLPNRYTYTGRESSAVSGDYYFRYRTYGAAIGGFLTRDPLGYVDGMSQYGGYFAMGMGIDPLGTNCCDSEEEYIVKKVIGTSAILRLSEVTFLSTNWVEGKYWAKPKSDSISVGAVVVGYESFLHLVGGQSGYAIIKYDITFTCSCNNNSGDWSIEVDDNAKKYYRIDSPVAGEVSYNTKTRDDNLTIDVYVSLKIGWSTNITTSVGGEIGGKGGKIGGSINFGGSEWMESLPKKKYTYRCEKQN